MQGKPQKKTQNSWPPGWYSNRDLWNMKLVC